MWEKIERLLSVVVACAAAGIAIGVWRQDRRPVLPPVPLAAPQLVASWSDLLQAGTLAGRIIGDSAAKVKVLEFADLECPFCKKFNGRFQALKRKFGSNVALVFVHFPIQGHRFARPAAEAAECAAAQGRFGPFVDAVYEHQDSLGLKPWSSFAETAGIRDTSLFARCVHRTNSTARIEAGRALGEKYAVNATPTVIVGGWRFPKPPDDSTLTETVAALIAGNTPFSKPR